MTVVAGITEAQRVALEALSPALDEATYLAGDVAVAIQLHHRTSLDLDLFVAHDFDADRLVERLLALCTPSSPACRSAFFRFATRCSRLRSRSTSYPWQSRPSRIWRA